MRARVRVAAGLVSGLTVGLLLAACGSQGAASETGTGQGGADSDRSSVSAGPDQAPPQDGTAAQGDTATQDESLSDADKAKGLDGTGRCPGGVTAGSLGPDAEVGTADIDGDGSADSVAVGAVPGVGPGCAVALLVTTATGTFAAPVPGVGHIVGDSPLADPAFAQVDGEAGDEIVLTTSFHPRGGGELGMFSWVDGGLVQVQQNGKPWALFATVDDGGGTPRLLSCADGGFTDVTAYPPGGGDTGSTVTAFALRDGVVSEQRSQRDGEASWEQVRVDYPALPRSGLAIFPDCE